MSKSHSTVTYLNKRYNMERDAYTTAEGALHHFLEARWKIKANDLPDTVELYDVKLEVERCLKHNDFEAAASTLNNFLEQYQPF